MPTERLALVSGVVASVFVVVGGIPVVAVKVEREERLLLATLPAVYARDRRQVQAVIPHVAARRRRPSG